MSTRPPLIWIPNESSQTLGGGWTFGRNIAKSFAGQAVFSAEPPQSAAIMLVPGSTMVSTAAVNTARSRGLKIVLRVDNVPRNSRNRNTGTSRLKAMAEAADMLVYQSEWARQYLKPFLGRDGVVIHNACDTDTFRPEGDSVPTSGDPVYLYSRYNRDETKSWERAWYAYQILQREQPSAELLILGQFSPEQIQYRFDFFMDEHFQYLGIKDRPAELAAVYRAADYLIASYFNDACSNTYIEALCSGCQLYEPDMSGGTPELLDLWGRYGRGYFSLDRLAGAYRGVFAHLGVAV